MSCIAAKRVPAVKSRDEVTLEKKQELEKRLENVKGVLGAPPTTKKPPKKGAA